MIGKDERGTTITGTTTMTRTRTRMGTTRAGTIVRDRWHGRVQRGWNRADEDNTDWHIEEEEEDGDIEDGEDTNRAGEAEDRDDVGNTAKGKEEKHVTQIE